MSETTTNTPGTWVRGITIRQPWAACILAGKDVENRTRPWPWRGLVLLHAGRATDRAVLRDPLVATTIRGRDLHTGAVIGVARITGCHQDSPGAPPCSPWAEPDAFHLVLADIQELALPVPAKGALGPWIPTRDLTEQILLQLPHLRPPAP